MCVCSGFQITITKMRLDIIYHICNQPSDQSPVRCYMEETELFEKQKTKSNWTLEEIHVYQSKGDEHTASTIPRWANTYSKQIKSSGYKQI